MDAGHTTRFARVDYRNDDRVLGIDDTVRTFLVKEFERDTIEPFRAVTFDPESTCGN